MKTTRIASIDILRALTMFLMLWVNDFPTLTKVPKWLNHASRNEDFLGFSDIILPLFLFIVGLSIPLAIEFRIKSKKSMFSTVKHIISRSASLVLIGIYMVNYETAHSESMIINRYYWCLLMALSVFLIWTNWSKSPINEKYHIFLRGLGILVLILLAMIYKGGTDGTQWMTTQWWGILGLIGWAYLINALVYLFATRKLIVMIGLLMLFFSLQLFHKLELLPASNSILSMFNTIYGGTIPAFTSAGIVAILLYKKIANKGEFMILGTFTLIGALFFIYGFAMRPYWGISKLQGTPAWSGICIGIGFMLFALLHYIVDYKQKISWAKIIGPAGTATLTCYLIPYFIYPLRIISDFRLPDIFNIGITGLITSVFYALLVVVFTGFLEKKGIKLKL